MAKRAATTKVQLKVRMQEFLRAQLAEAAKENGVSLNQEIVDRLERSVSTSEVIEGVHWAVKNLLFDQLNQRTKDIIADDLEDAFIDLYDHRQKGAKK